MNELKTYIIRIIIVSAIVQFGVIVSGDKYKKTYSLVGAIFIVFSLISIPWVNIDDISFGSYIDINFESNTIADEFTEGVSKKISDEILKNFEIDALVNVSTDSSYTNISITIECQCSDEIKHRIESYISKTFCTPNDEVIVING